MIKNRYLKRIMLTVTAAALSVSMLFPVSAADMSNYTGWNTEGQRVAYYVNGVKATNIWIQYNNSVYFIGSDGYIATETVVDVAYANALGVNYVKPNTNMRYDIPIMQTEDKYSAAKLYYNVTSDYEAFKVLYPEKVAVFGTNEQGLHDYYVATYCGQVPGDEYLKALDGFIYSYYYHMHSYTNHFEYNSDERTHKAYCGCGAYIVEPCDISSEALDKKGNIHTCAKCHQHFKHYKNDR